MTDKSVVPPPTDAPQRATVYLFANGNSAVFVDGEQVAAAQKPWFRCFMEHLESVGIDPTLCDFNMPDGSLAGVERRDDGGTSWFTVRR